MLSTVTPPSSRSDRSSVTPSRSSASQCRRSCPAGATGAPSPAGSRAVSSAASPEQAAVTQSTDAPGSANISPPTSAGPTMVSTPCRPSRSPATRSTGTPPALAISGSRLSLAVMPGRSNTAPTTPNSMNQPRSRPKARSTTGSAATLSAEATSAPTDTRRRPHRSITTPPTNEAANMGRPVTAARVPAAAASPVRVSTSQGRTRPAITLPSRDNADEAR